MASLQEKQTLYNELREQIMGNSGESQGAEAPSEGDLPRLIVPARLRNSAPILWNHLIAGALAAGRPQEAKKVYDQMKKVGVHPDSRTYTTFFSVLLKDVINAQRATRDAPAGAALHAPNYLPIITNLHQHLGALRAAVAENQLKEAVGAADATVEVSSNEEEEFETHILRASTPAERWRITRDHIVAAERRDYSHLARAYATLVTLYANSDQPETAWRVYEELSQATPLGGKFVLPFPHRVIFSNSLSAMFNGYWTARNVTSPAKDEIAAIAASASGSNPSLPARGEDDPRTVWRTRAMTIVTTWMRELERDKQQQNRFSKFSDSIRIDARDVALIARGYLLVSRANIRCAAPSLTFFYSADSRQGSC